MRTFGTIRNPLTIIAIFAGIAEVSGTAVLPFVSQANQQVFIYFLIFFPILLVTLFFLTLNFNNRVLYAPSDYENEDNFIKVIGFDYATQKQIQVSVPKAGSYKEIKTMDNEFKVEVINFEDVGGIIDSLRKKGYNARVYEDTFKKDIEYIKKSIPLYG